MSAHRSVLWPSARQACLASALVFATTAYVLFISPAHAATLLTFGDDERLHYLEATPLVIAGNKTSLGFKTTLSSFLIPYAVRDDGYVLLAAGLTDSYYPLAAADIAAYQRLGLLPDPLPKYDVPLLERLLALSPFLVAGLAIAAAVRAFWPNRKTAG